MRRWSVWKSGSEVAAPGRMQFRGLAICTEVAESLKQDLYQRGCACDKQHLNDNDNVDMCSVKFFKDKHPRL